MSQIVNDDDEAITNQSDIYTEEADRSEGLVITE